MNQADWQEIPPEERYEAEQNDPESYPPQQVQFERFDPEPLLALPFWLKIALLLLALGLILIVSWSTSSGVFSFGQSGTEYVPADRSGGLEYRPRADTAPPAPPDYVAETEAPEWFYSNRTNVRVPIPEGWQQLDVGDVRLPVGVEDPQFVFVDAQAGCAFAAATFNRSGGDYAQTSFAQRLFTDGMQFDGNWFTDQSYHEQSIEFSDHDRQYLSHELLVYQNLDTAEFMLWQLERNAVPNSCVGDVRSVITSLAPHFLERPLESYHTGEISTRRVRLGEARTSPVTELLFTDRNNGNTYRLQTLPNPVGQHRLFLVDDSLYFMGATQAATPLNQGVPSIYRYELSSDTLTESFRAERDDAPVIGSYYVADEWFYYLSGPTSSARCLDKPIGGCGFDLYRAPLDSLFDIELVATNTDAATILGYDAELDTLYLANGYGDAGCVTREILVFDGEAVTSAATLGGCVGDPGYAEYETEINTLHASFEARTADAVSHRYGEYAVSDWDPGWHSISFLLVPAP